MSEQEILAEIDEIIAEREKLALRMEKLWELIRLMQPNTLIKRKGDL